MSCIIAEPKRIAYPDGYPDRETDEESELNFLKEKVDAGADFIATQLFYDVDRFLQWEMKVRSKGACQWIQWIRRLTLARHYRSRPSWSFPNTNIFIFPTTYQALRDKGSFQHHRGPGTHSREYMKLWLNISDWKTEQHDDQKVKDYGVSLAVDIIRRITTEAKDIRGVHFCTLNLERSVQLVLEKLHWAGGSPLLHNQIILVRLLQQIAAKGCLIFNMPCRKLRVQSSIRHSQSPTCMLHRLKQ